MLTAVEKLCTKLNCRFNWHRTGFNHPEQYGHCRILTDHLNIGVCKNASKKSNGYFENFFRKRRETFWMLQLRTAFAYGLSDRIGDKSKKEVVFFYSF